MVGFYAAPAPCTLTRRRTAGSGCTDRCQAPALASGALALFTTPCHMSLGAQQAPCAPEEPGAGGAQQPVPEVRDEQPPLTPDLLQHQNQPVMREQAPSLRQALASVMRRDIQCCLPRQAYSMGSRQRVGPPGTHDKPS